MLSYFLFIGDVFFNTLTHSDKINKDKLQLCIELFYITIDMINLQILTCETFISKG